MSKEEEKNYDRSSLISELQRIENNQLIQGRTPNFINSVSVNCYAKLVEVRIEFITLGEIDTMNEKFNAEVRIKARWYDDEEIDEYDKKKHWSPKLFIENALADKYQEDISYTVMKIDGKSIVTETRFARVASKLKPNQVKIVADTQKHCSMHSEALNTFRDQQKFRLYRLVETIETATYDMGSQLSIGKPSNVSKFSEFHQVKYNKNSKRSKIIASCFASRIPWYYIMNVYFFNMLITVLSLTIFAFEASKAQNRIGGTFTLILTSVSFKTALSRTIPTISYMTSVDKYQIISIIYLVMCCIWHSTIASINMDTNLKIYIDQIALCVFAFMFTSIQVVTIVGILISYKKLDAYKRKEENFIKFVSNEDSEDEAL